MENIHFFLERVSGYCKPRLSAQMLFVCLFLAMEDYGASLQMYECG